MDSQQDAPPHLAPWDPEPSVQWTETMEEGFRQRRLIRTSLRDLGMQEDNLYYWTERLESVSAIIQRGCVLDGIPNAGELLMDMVTELLQDIQRCGMPPQVEEAESPAQLGEQSRELHSSYPSHGAVSAAGILGRDPASSTSRSSSDVIPGIQTQGQQEFAQLEAHRQPGYHKS